MSTLLSTDLWYKILECIEDPSPRLFLMLARVNRYSREVFLSDTAWAHLDVYNAKDSPEPGICYIYKDYSLHGIAGHFMNYLSKQDTGLRHYYLLGALQNISSSERPTERGDLYFQLQVLADGEGGKHPHQLRCFDVRVWDIWSRHLHGTHSLINYLEIEFKRSDSEYSRQLRIYIAYESQKKIRYDLQKQCYQFQPAQRYRSDREANLAMVAAKLPCDDYFDTEKSFMLKAVKLWGDFYYRTSGPLRSDWDIIHAAIDADSSVWRHIPKSRLAQDEKLQVKIVEQHPELLVDYEKNEEEDEEDDEKHEDSLSNSIDKNQSYKSRNVVLAAVSKFGLALAYAGDELRNDKEVVITALKSDNPISRAKMLNSMKSFRLFYGALSGPVERRCVFYHASDTLKNDRDVVLTAVTNNPASLKLASPQLQCDHEIIMAAAKHRQFVLVDLAETFRHDRVIVLQAVTANGDNLQYAPNSLKNDREIVMAAVKSKADALRHAPIMLQDDEDVAMAALTNTLSPASRMLLVFKFASPYWFDSGPNTDERDRTCCSPCNENASPVSPTQWACNKKLFSLLSHFMEVTIYS